MIADVVECHASRSVEGVMMVGRKSRGRYTYTPTAQIMYTAPKPNANEAGMPKAGSVSSDRSM